MLTEYIVTIHFFIIVLKNNSLLFNNIENNLLFYIIIMFSGGKNFFSINFPKCINLSMLKLLQFVYAV